MFKKMCNHFRFSEKVASRLASTLQLESLELYREDHLIFTDISFRIESGDHLVIRGQNGSGKTSLIRTICGLTQADKGLILWNEISIDQSLINYYEQLAYLGHKNGLIPELTLDENINYGLHEADKAEQDQGVKGFRLDGLRHSLIQNLSNGESRKTALSKVISSKKPLWVLDEPYANLDSDSISYLNNSIGEHINKGGIVITSTNRNDTIETKTTELLMGSS